MPPPEGPAPHVERALCVLAHPDDVDFGSAGTVAAWTAAGTEVTYCIVTDGDAGGFDDTPREQMAPLRRAEQTAAAAAVGVTDVRFLGYPDGRLELTLDLRRDISRVIRQVRPQRVLTSSPERFYERIGASHPDHMTVGESTLRAVYPDARNPFAFPELLADEGLDAWTVSRGLAPAAPAPTTSWTSPTSSTGSSPRCSATSPRSATSRRGSCSSSSPAGCGGPRSVHGLPEGRLAEAFHVVHTG